MRIIYFLALFFLSNLQVLFSELQNIYDGITYDRRLVKMNDQKQVLAHIVIIDPLKAEIVPVAAQDKACGVEKVSHIAQRSNALVAINGGFFKGGDFEGVPAGILKIKSAWISSQCRTRGVAGWSCVGSDFAIDLLQMQTRIFIDNKAYPVSLVNQPRSSFASILYNDTFNKKTLTNNRGHEIVIANNHVIDIRNKKGNSRIPSNGFVYSIGRNASIDLSAVQVGASVSVKYQFLSTDKAYKQGLDWASKDYFINGSPVLISSGNIITNFDREKILKSFIEKRHARTALGVRQDNHLMLVVIDGYGAQGSVGMNLHELAEFMHKQGCVDALNLDGGTSSTMWVSNKVVNNPCTPVWLFNWYGERKVGDALIVRPKIN